MRRKDLSAPVRLETDRLTLSAPLEVAAAGAVAAYQRRNQAHFRPWEPRRPREYFTRSYWRDQLIGDAEGMEEESRARFFVRERGDERVIAHLHFANIVRGAFESCHLGFGLDVELVGAGVMREALTASIAWAFDELGLHRIEANHRPENLRSAAVLRRLGFVPQGYARDYLFIDGAWRDHVLTALTNERWVEP